jgi:hypothetical protein
MNQYITLAELILILVISLPVYALGKTIIQTINNKNK